MRWVVLLLLAANLAFLGWRLNADEAPPPPAAISRVSHVNRLLLLAEMDARELRSRAPERSLETRVDSAPDANSPARSQTPSGVCFSIGPVPSDDGQRRMNEWLVERGGQANLKSGERRELALYWIYFPPLETRDAARARVSEMQSKGIEDIFTISRGDMAKAVSLGVYSRKTSLDRRMAELEEKGYKPKVALRYRQKKGTWFDVQFKPGFEFPGDKFTLAFPGAQVRPTACNRAMPELDLGETSAVPQARPRALVNKTPGSAGG